MAIATPKPQIKATSNKLPKASNKTAPALQPKRTRIKVPKNSPKYSLSLIGRKEKRNYGKVILSNEIETTFF